MKKLVNILAGVIISVSIFAQSPQMLSFQAVVRNNNNALVTSTTIGMKISILQGSGSGSAVYVETHAPTTNINGLVTLEIGLGVVLTGNFSTIDWANGPYFVKTETDLSGGNTYTITGTSQLLSVPYALYAAKSGNENAWLLNGNTGTIPSSHFLGTTDNVPLNFRVNNVSAGSIDKTLENTFLGFMSGNSAVSGTSNTGSGAYALASVTSGYNNTAVGRGALRSNSTGIGNTATGHSALVQNTIGTANTANGSQALQNNATGVNNTAMGYSALISNTTGGDNSALGLNALQANIGGMGNTGIGSAALLYNTTGNYNTGIGNGALFLNTTGSNNTALGNNASVSSNNLTNATALGYNARAAGSSTLILGNNDVNVGIGLSGLIPGNKLEINTAVANTSGLRFRMLTTTATPITNPGIGILTVDANGDVVYALAGGNNASSDAWSKVGNAGTDASNFIGTTDNIPLNIRVNNIPAGKIDNMLGNVFLGSEAGIHNTTASSITAIGYFALPNNTTGMNNTALGSNALFQNTTGSNNVALGVGALANSFGSDNIAIGNNTLMTNSTGNQNTALGTNAYMPGTLSNTTIIGYGATATASNTIKLGNANVTDVSTAGTLTAGTVTYPNTIGNAGEVLTLPLSGGTAYWSAPTGGGSRMQPFTAINYIIATQGSFPSTGGSAPGTTLIGEVKMFAGNFAPSGWEFCDGQILAISSNTALFSILGTTYGGNGSTTFSLPDLRGRVTVHAGQGSGLTNRPLGSTGGAE